MIIPQHDMTIADRNFCDSLRAHGKSPIRCIIHPSVTYSIFSDPKLSSLAPLDFRFGRWVLQRRVANGSMVALLP